MAESPSQLAPPVRLHGHLDGLDQPSTSIRLLWRAPKPLLDAPGRTLALLERWLREGFDVHSSILTTTPNFNRSEANAHLEQAAWHILELGQALLQMLEIPVFHPGILHQVQKDPAQQEFWKISATTATLDHLPKKIHGECYLRAANLLHGIAYLEPTRSEITKLQERVQRDHVEQMRSFIPRGKSTYFLLSFAYRRRVPFRHLGLGVYSLGWGSQRRRMRGGGIDKDSMVGGILSHNKAVAREVLLIAGLPVPDQYIIDSEAAAAVAAKELGWPVVLKPADCDRGEGVTIDIRDPEQLNSAWQEARRFSAHLLLERQISGVCHRLHVCDGQLISAWRRRPKSVQGDGILSVQDLIDKANAELDALPPWKRLKPFACDDLAVRCLEAHDLSLASVPAKGKWAPLRPFNAPAWGGVVEEVDGTIHPDNVSLAIQAASLFDLSNAGIDLISTDIAESWHRNGAAINEVNHSPLAPERPQLLEKIFDSHCPADGRIPIEVFIGKKEAWNLSMIKQQHFNASGRPCWVTDHERSVDCSGRELLLTARGLFDRCHALMCSREVSALIVVVSDTDLLSTGLPFDRSDHCQIMEDWQPKPDERAWAKLLSWLQPELKSITAGELA